jgi:hypothetical protein
MKYISILAFFEFLSFVQSAQIRSQWSWIGDDIPQPRTTSPMTPSACANGGRGGEYAFACPHHAMLSLDMELAAKYDNLQEFVYATAGSGGDADCGTCFQVQLLDAERVWKPDFPQLIVQVTNSGFDVMAGQLDLFMGAGGFGYFNACSRDCSSNFCQGGPCAEGLYDGDFAAWTQAHYPDVNNCYSGGVKWLNETSNKQMEILCKALSNGQQQYKDLVLFDSCVKTNRQLFHQNFLSTRYRRVQCPPGLVKLTGMQRQDDDAYPLPSTSHDLDQSCQGSREGGHYCVTTAQDCCCSSCSWGGKVATHEGWGRVDRCDRNGQIIN